ncbi:MAG: SpoIIE family protein phosphatase [Prevotella sp.]|nr:SpoIIE family protein phosphatase [Prevotella sp.]
MNKTIHFWPLVTLLLIAFSLDSCRYQKHLEVRASHADSAIFAIGVTKDYERMRMVTDSFEMEGDITALNANRWRGVSYYRQGQYNMAELCFRKALESDIKTNEDQLSYNKVTRRLSELLLVKGDFEGSLRIAIPAVAKMEKTGIGSDIDYAILLNNIGICQLHLGRDQEAEESFITARGHYANRWQTDTTSRGFQEAVLGTVYTSQAYINTRRYAESIYWIDRTEMLLNMYRKRHDARTEYFDEYQGRIEIMRAIAMEGLHKSKEAEEAYKRFQKTAYSQTAAGHINANEYLVVAHRYQEAAYNYRYLDKALSDWGTEITLDNIQLYMLPKYRANAEAGRRDSAVVIGQRILNLLDSAITSQKNSATAELATIYDTQGKEAEIARKEADLSQTRLVSTGVALVLLIIFFLVYTLHKRRAAHRLRDAHVKLEEAHGKLEDAHAKLQTAYDQLEKTTKAKERIESELRIARDIQMSMVPNIFPDYDGIDIYAAMTPAKEVGGDLYGYLLQGDELYFCVGDVSGKGVPASLFMAQATRLFRTLAAQHMKPAEICTRMNAALTDDNEQGMFVTLFLGLAHLSSGLLEFCNAGHNPPVIGSEPHFLEVDSNAPIGLWPDIDFVGEQVDNIKGQPFFVYTDGLNEAENPQQEQFGDDRLLAYLKSVHGSTGKDVVEQLKAKVESHRNGAEPNDDLTMLYLRIN